MEIKQRRNSNRIGYVFGDPELQYSIQGSSDSRSFTVAYSDISPNHQTPEERKNGWATSAYSRVALGVVLAMFSAFSDKGLAPSFWLFVGGCYPAYRLRTTRFTIVP